MPCVSRTTGATEQHIKTSFTLKQMTLITHTHTHTHKSSTKIVSWTRHISCARWLYNRGSTEHFNTFTVDGRRPKWSYVTPKSLSMPKAMQAKVQIFGYVGKSQLNCDKSRSLYATNWNQFCRKQRDTTMQLDYKSHWMKPKIFTESLTVSED